MLHRIFPLVLFCCILLFAGLPVSGQENPGQKVFKLYTNFMYKDPVRTEYGGPGSNTVTVVQYGSIRTGYFTPAVALSRLNGDYHEFELSDFTINRTDEKVTYVYGADSASYLVSGERNIELGLALGYTYNLDLLKGKPDARLRPVIGFSAGPYFSRSSMKPFVSLSYPVNETRVGITLGIIPGIQYNIYNNWYLEFNVPVSVVDLGIHFENVENPVLADEQHKNSTFEIQEFPAQVHLRLGAGLRF
jgi:hypothetical protein